MGIEKKPNEQAQRLVVNDACKQVIIRKVQGLKPIFVTYDLSRKLEPPHCNIWVNMLHGYCSILDSSIDHINAQPHAKMNEMKNKLDENCEYVWYELSYQKFKAQVNVFFKNKRDVLELLIESKAL
jgi:hypothetical protein